MKLAYLVHDLSDAAVHRRVRMLLGPGLDLRLLGFRRSADPVAAVEGVRPLDLGRTADRKLARRVASVVWALLCLPRWAGAIRGAEVVMARQLETLLVAAVARRLLAPRAKLVFECLDIHAKMTAPGRAGRVLRAIEGALLRRCALLVVSAPDFVEHYFRPTHASLPPVLLLENKVLEGEVVPPPPRAPGPPWRIGWFGVLRCARSLELLAGLCRALPGQVEVVLRGRPARGVIPDFDAAVSNTPGLSFGGAYDRATELGALYGGVHFIWAMDFYEAGGNSDWLLPNRLYEGGATGTVPIALASVATGRWLTGAGMGVLLDEPLAPALQAAFAGMDEPRFRALAGAVTAVPAERFTSGPAERQAILDRLATP